MSYQRPIFKDGLYGKANAEVMNGLVDGVAMVRQYEAALAWAEIESQKNQLGIRYFLGRITSASVLSGGIYRWVYSGNPVITTGSTTNTVQDMNDGSDLFTNALNLREMFNNSGWVDGMDTTNPAVNVGPVGSTWTGSAWQLTNLRAVCIVGTWFNYDGTPRYFFDRPNPIRCSS